MTPDTVDYRVNVEFKIDNFNPKSLFSELNLSCSPDSSSHQQFDLIVELRCSEDILSDDEYGDVFSVSLKRGFFELDLNGCEIMAGTRYGEHDKSSTISFKVSKEEITRHSKKGEGGGAISTGFSLKKLFSVNASISGGCDAAISHESVCSRINESEEAVRRVTALGGNTWEISEPEGEGVLRGRYLGDENLCNIKAKKKIYKVIGYFKCLPKDLSVQLKKSSTNMHFLRRKFAVNYTRVINLLLTKGFEKKGDYLVISKSSMRPIYRRKKK
ncbi:MAG: hypothetical protein DHS20C13_28080 [Thermodesulfobacteriota bacterium]|nr:MAG: hypothetical protein DHS20C13_28080 [Thermodesulfobacteriota bacterium]